MDGNPKCYSRFGNDDVYEYDDEYVLPSDSLVGQANQGAAISRHASPDQRQNFYRLSSQRSSLTSSQVSTIFLFQGQNIDYLMAQESGLLRQLSSEPCTSSSQVGAICFCQSQNIDWPMAQEHGLRQPFHRSISQPLPAHWVNVGLLSCIRSISEYS